MLTWNYFLGSRKAERGTISLVKSLPTGVAPQMTGGGACLLLPLKLHLGLLRFSRDSS